MAEIRVPILEERNGVFDKLVVDGGDTGVPDALRIGELPDFDEDEIPSERCAVELHGPVEFHPAYLRVGRVDGDDYPADVAVMLAVRGVQRVNGGPETLPFLSPLDVFNPYTTVEHGRKTLGEVTTPSGDEPDGDYRDDNSG